MKKEKFAFKGVRIDTINDYKTLKELKDNLNSTVTAFKNEIHFVYLMPKDDLLKKAWLKRVLSLNYYKDGLLDDVILLRQYGDKINDIELSPMVYTGEQSNILFTFPLTDYLSNITSGQSLGSFEII